MPDMPIGALVKLYRIERRMSVVSLAPMLVSLCATWR
jgi:hypothetical protein